MCCHKHRELHLLQSFSFSLSPTHSLTLCDGYIKRPWPKSSCQYSSVVVAENIDVADNGVVPSRLTGPGTLVRGSGDSPPSCPSFSSVVRHSVSHNQSDPFSQNTCPLNQRTGSYVQYERRCEELRQCLGEPKAGTSLLIWRCESA